MPPHRQPSYFDDAQSARRTPQSRASKCAAVRTDGSRAARERSVPRDGLSTAADLHRAAVELPLTIRVVSIARVAANVCAIVVFLGLALASIADAQTPVPTEPEEAYANLLDGTLSGKGDQEDADILRRGWLRFPTLLDPWFSRKQQWR